VWLTLAQFAVVMQAIGTLCVLRGLIKRYRWEERWFEKEHRRIRSEVRRVLEVVSRFKKLVERPPDDVSGVIRFREEDDTAHIRAHHRQPTLRADAWTEDRVAWLECWLSFALSQLDELGSESVMQVEAMQKVIQERDEDYNRDLESLGRRGWEKAGTGIISTGLVFAVLDIFM
jgi:hypothetical protein